MDLHVACPLFKALSWKYCYR